MTALYSLVILSHTHTYTGAKLCCRKAVNACDLDKVTLKFLKMYNN